MRTERRTWTRRERQGTSGRGGLEQLEHGDKGRMHMRRQWVGQGREADGAYARSCPPLAPLCLSTERRAACTCCDGGWGRREKRTVHTLARALL